METTSKSRAAIRRVMHGDHIWALAIGYFLAYIPYTFMTKATTDGLLPGIPAVKGLAVLPASAIATFVCIYAFVTALGWWRYVGWRRVAGIPIPNVRGAAALSGICMAVIIGSTTMAYSFTGISIVLMLVLMKAGVLILARVTDLTTKRAVRWESLAALGITLGAVSVTLLGQDNLHLSVPAIICIAAYLAGYAFRFQAMDRLSSKGNGQSELLRYFVEEQAVAMPALVAICALWAMFDGGAAAQLREGFALLSGSPSLLPTLMVGACYAGLYIFGTMIYLNPREYTFCVPVNRASSILAGVVASFAISILFHRPSPSARDLWGAALLITALIVLATPALRAMWADRRRLASAPIERIFLFVCAGNTARSPIAQAICTWEMAERLGLSIDTLRNAGITVMSAGLTARVGKPMKPEAVAALEQLGVRPHDHIASQITPELIDRATMVCCMTDEQRDALLELAPSAAAKIRRLGPHGDLDEPTGHEATLDFAGRVREALRSQLGELMMAGV